MTLTWEAVDDVDALARVRALLEELGAVLVAERDAIAKLASETITALTSDKERILVELAAIAQRFPSEVEDRETVTRRASEPVRALRQDIALQGMRVRLSAQANAALLLDAVDAVSGVLGLGGEAETYDRHARKLSRSRNLGGKAA